MSMSIEINTFSYPLINRIKLVIMPFSLSAIIYIYIKKEKKYVPSKAHFFAMGLKKN